MVKQCTLVFLCPTYHSQMSPATHVMSYVSKKTRKEQYVLMHPNATAE
jgi:hypothetical protein